MQKPITKPNVPHHLAIIPDGNRRWAKNKRLSAWVGHERSTSMFKKILETALDEGIPYTTFWAASIDNLTKRSKQEVSQLLKIMQKGLSDPGLNEFIEERQINISVLGEWERVVLDTKLKATIRDLVARTKKYTQGYLTILLAYDGKLEMMKAIQKTVRKGKATTESNLRQSLLTGMLPDVDLVIRTGGQPHWSSGFMMWLTANSEFYFTETLWPDFAPSSLLEALRDYQLRDRKLGK